MNKHLTLVVRIGRITVYGNRFHELMVERDPAKAGFATSIIRSLYHDRSGSFVVICPNMDDDGVVWTVESGVSHRASPALAAVWISRWHNRELLHAGRVTESELVAARL